MQHVATALAIAVVCIEDFGSDADANAKALEAIAADIQQGSLDERRAVAEALNTPGRPELIDGLGKAYGINRPPVGGNLSACLPEETRRSILAKSEKIECA
ncbi:hypothetical protein [Brucella cytisi]|uniref:Uncharacterized protein n=1 Tax=Brucella cytisi TaxID=407152 RepID=A0A1J6HQ74_9HYPH|nr:hypothetical protein [Brucella cytisi]OIS95117.1 hypothetical protein BLA27_03815 [Brucella cytisi]